MKRIKPIIFLWLVLFLAFSMPTMAQELPWIDDFNKQAAEDLETFKNKLAKRFSSDLDQVEAILKDVKTAADAYMTYKLGEMSGKSASEVAKTYGKGKKKGWGALAKSLGIKPGSEEFHALKKGHDLDRPVQYSTDEENNKGKWKGKGKNKKKKKDK